MSVLEGLTPDVLRNSTDTCAFGDCLKHPYTAPDEMLYEFECGGFRRNTGHHFTLCEEHRAVVGLKVPGEPGYGSSVVDSTARFDSWWRPPRRW